MPKRSAVNWLQKKKKREQETLRKTKHNPPHPSWATLSIFLYEKKLSGTPQAVFIFSKQGLCVPSCYPDCSLSCCGFLFFLSQVRVTHKIRGTWIIKHLFFKLPNLTLSALCNQTKNLDVDSKEKQPGHRTAFPQHWELGSITNPNNWKPLTRSPQLGKLVQTPQRFPFVICVFCHSCFMACISENELGDNLENILLLLLPYMISYYL